MQEQLSLLSIAKTLQIPESTLRYYIRKFDEYIPTTGEGRKKRYRPEAVEVLQIIADMFKDNRSVTDIANHLSLSFPINIESVKPSPLSSLTTYSPSSGNELPAIFKDFLALHAEVINQSLAKDKVILEQHETIKQKDIEISQFDEALTNANSELRNMAKIKQEAEQKTKVLADQRAALEAREKELAEIRAKAKEKEKERLKKRGFFQRLFNK